MWIYFRKPSVKIYQLGRLQQKWIKMIKIGTEEVIVPIINYMNKCISWSTFSDEFKIADIYSVYKKENVNYKTSYRPISSLPIISKIFEKVLYE